jgi:phospholipase/lecithinase/hemolysin
MRNVVRFQLWTNVQARQQFNGGKLFFDRFHPTAAAHQILGQEFAAAVPEPATCALVRSGALAVLRKRKLTMQK